MRGVAAGMTRGSENTSPGTPLVLLDADYFYKSSDSKNKFIQIPNYKHHGLTPFSGYTEKLNV